MKKTIVTVLCAAFFLGTLAAAVATAAEHEEHHPGAEQGAAAEKSGMMGQMMPGMTEMMGTMMQGKGMMEMMGQGKGMMMGGMACPEPSTPSAMLHMMGDVLSGRMMMDPAMMHHMMGREFFLDRVEELGLSEEQVAKLKAIRAACRKDNIRTAAELKIARLELDDLLGGEWSLPAAEKLVRHIQKLEGDMKVRHLQAVDAARKVLTAEQLEKAETKGVPLEQLF